MFDERSYNDLLDKLRSHEKKNGGRGAQDGSAQHENIEATVGRMKELHELKVR